MTPALRLSLLLCASPTLAAACALPAQVILTLPTGITIWAAAAVVAVTGLMGAKAGWLPELRAVPLCGLRPPVSATATSYVAALAFFGLLAVGWMGATDPMHNLLTLVFWTGVWVALPLASMVTGNLWRLVNPWAGPVRLMRVALGRTGGIGLARLGHWPAVAGMAGFGWFLLVSLAPEDPRELATAAAVYWAAVYVLAVLEGEDWLEQGEFLTVYFRALSRIAPVWVEAVDGGRVRLMAGWPGAQVLRMAPMSASGVAFITLALAVLTFDGLSTTFWWLAVVGENPLEFTGRSAVQVENTAGLLATWVLTAAAILAAIRLGGAGMRAGPVCLSFLAIAAGYHAAHHLTILLTTGQYALFALNDPLFRGDSLLGLPPFYVSFGFLSDPGAVAVIWAAQVAFILGAHVLAVLLALRLAGPEVRAAAHLPLTVLMIGYTVLGLWLLSSPQGA